jgi:hypothetical protein
VETAIRQLRAAWLFSILRDGHAILYVPVTLSTRIGTIELRIPRSAAAHFPSLREPDSAARRKEPARGRRGGPGALPAGF